MDKFREIVSFIKSLYPDKNPIPLHEPIFCGNEKEYVLNAIDSTYVSSVGKYVDRFENMICDISGSSFAVAVVNGTSALHIALKLVNVSVNDEVITQPISFVATANAIAYCNAKPVFVDVSLNTLGIDPYALEQFLRSHAERRTDGCYNKITGRMIKACIPMHTFGHSCQIDEVADICDYYNIALIEDAAESLGTKYKGQHTGTFGICGIFSFNGNKIATCGGGGAIVTNRKALAQEAKHITTTAKVPHSWEYIHDQTGYNYRLPNLNAALGCAQLEMLEKFIENKRELALIYETYFKSIQVPFIQEPNNCCSNFWLNSIVFNNRKERDNFLNYSNVQGIMTRPIWTLLPSLSMYKKCQVDSLVNARWLEDRIVNIPSGVRKWK